MPLLDITNPAIINFLLESYEKENRLRMRWADHHTEKFQQAATLPLGAKNYTPTDIAEATIVSGMEATTRDHIVAARHKMTAPVKDFLLQKNNITKQPAPSMLQIKQEEKEILFESKKDYFKERNKKAPEDKYYFMESENWRYGWKLDDSELKMQGPAHGRVAHTMHLMKSRVGPQPDPDHYNSPDTNRGFCASL